MAAQIYNFARKTRLLTWGLGFNGNPVTMKIAGPLGTLGTKLWELPIVTNGDPSAAGSDGQEGPWPSPSSFGIHARGFQASSSSSSQICRRRLCLPSFCFCCLCSPRNNLPAAMAGGPYSGTSTLALVARISAVSVGVVYGSMKLAYLKARAPAPVKH